MQVYADNAATTRMSQASLDAMMSCMKEVYGNPSSQHQLGQQAKVQLDSARAKIASSLHCSPREIYFTSGGSEADNQAILSAASLGEKCGKKHIITTAFEHPAVLNTLKKLKSRGFEITCLKIDPETHNVSAKALEREIRPETCLVTCMYANNEIGSILPIKEMGSICRKAGVLFHVDAVQAIGHIPVDTEADHIDLMSLSGHKFHGPKGVGALYARRGISLDSLILGGGQERGKRAGTENLPGICGMAAALSESCSRMEEDLKNIRELRDYLTEGLLKIPGSFLNGDPKNRLPGHVNISFEGIEGESLLVLLDHKGICASAGSACSSGSLNVSHVLLAAGRTEALARGSLRFSLGRYNSREEVSYLIQEVTEAVEQLRNSALG